MTTKQLCVHHWQIEEHRGPTSRGECRRCGSTREFLNSAPRLSWSEQSLDGSPARPFARRSSRKEDVRLSDETYVV